MIRVLHVVGGLNVGGTESWLAAGLGCIDRRQYRFDFLVHGDGPQHYRRQIEQRGARVLTCPDPRHLPAYLSGMWKILRFGKYDAVHTHTHAASGIALLVAALARVKIRVFHSHTAEDEAQSGSWRGAYFRLSRWMIGHFATCGVAVSDEAAAPLFPANWRRHTKKWRVLKGGIDLKAFERQFDRGAKRRELRIAESALAVVHVGRFAAVKNHALILEIAREMIAADESWVFVFVGDGELRKVVEERVNAAGLTPHFRTLGIRSDVAEVLKACDVFLMPSLFEGYPRAYLEAQAAGLPCVVSDVIATSAELVEGGTVRCYLEDPASAWANALRRIGRASRSGGVPPQMQSVSIEQSMQRLVECYR